MDTPKPESENPLLRPDHELPAPHDMLLEEGQLSQAVPSSNQPPPENSQHRSFPLWILPLIALLIVLLAGGIYLLNMQNQPPPQAPEPRESSVVTITPDPMANWQRYQDPEEHYAFSYPPSWYFGTDTKGSVCLGSDQRFIDFYCNNQTNIDPPAIGFKTTKVGLDSSIKVPANATPGAALKLESRREPLPLISESFTTVGSYPAYRAVRQASTGAVLRTDIEYTFLYKNQLYRLWFELDDTNPEEMIKLFDQVADTFTISIPTPTGSADSSSSASEGMTTACTMDAKICPDGSSVGRTGPNCTFAACPKN